MEMTIGGLRPDRMTSQERLASLFKGGPVDRVPFIPFMLGFSAVNVGLPLAEFYADPEKSYLASQMTIQQYDLDGTPTLGYADYGGWEFGGEAALPTGPHDQCLKVIRRPVQSEADGWNLKLPDIERAGFLPTLIEFSKQQLKYEGRATCPGMEPFAIASSTTGVQQFCLWMKKKPDLCHHLLRLALEHRLQVLDYWIDTFGLKNVRYATATGPESNYVISPAAFEEFVLPYTKEVHEKVLARGIKSIFCHICGEHIPNLPHWKKIPFGEPGMISLGPEMDFEKVAEYFGRDTIVMGNISPTVILTSSPEELYEQTRTCLEKGKKVLKRFVLMTGCELPVITPPYNLWVMRKAVSDFGWYE